MSWAIGLSARIKSPLHILGDDGGDGYAHNDDDNEDNEDDHRNENEGHFEHK